jgi:hypothetical protein
MMANVAVRAEHFALLDLAENALPTPSTMNGDGERYLFLVGSSVMELNARRM